MQVKKRRRQRTELCETLTLSSQGEGVETPKGDGEKATTSEVGEEQENGGPRAKRSC